MQSVLPPGTESGAGFEPPRVRQYTVFLDNRVGRLQTLVRAFEHESGKIVSLSILNAVDTALIRLIYSEPDLARQVLQREQFPFAEQDVLVVQLPKNSTHPLMSICGALLTAEINLHYAYPLLISPNGPALAIYVDDLTLAAQVLIRKQFTLIGESDFGKTF